jgi:hypothetical protein
MTPGKLLCGSNIFFCVRHLVLVIFCAAALGACETAEVVPAPDQTDPLGAASAKAGHMLSTSGEELGEEGTRCRRRSPRVHEGRDKDRVTVELWYAMPTNGILGSELVAVRRDIHATPAMAAATLRAWIKGPTCIEEEAGIVGSIPRGTRLRGVSISNGTAIVDLSRDFERTQLGTPYEGQLLEQLAWTITQFPTVDRALLKIEGRFKPYYMGHGFIIDDAHPLTRG